MSHIAELIKECIIDRKVVKEEVNRFRSGYREVRYSFDSIENKIETDSIKKTNKN